MQPAVRPQSSQPPVFTFSASTSGLISSQRSSNQAAKPSEGLVTVEQPWVNTRFGDHDSDVQIRSVDGFVFRLHRAVLELCTGSFPGPDVATQGEAVPLTENAKTLSILFSFIYPKRHPDLDNLDFQTVAAVAEAAGKYEVFAAMNTCNTRLGKFLPQHALDIFVHAVKHDYPKLMNEAVPHLCRVPLISVISKLPPTYMLAWAKYHEAWRAVFKEAAKYAKNLPATANVLSSPCDVGKGICNTCRCNLLILISNMEAIEDMSFLNSALQFPYLKFPMQSCCGHASTSTAASDPLCLFVKQVSNLCQEKIRAIPPFASFLPQKE